MSLSQLFAGGTGNGDEADAGQVQLTHTQSTQSIDDLLDQIDSVLETNAEAFVQGFVQKGGQ